MPFTKAQRLKGLKKQLRNLGYDVVDRGGSAPDVDRDEDDELKEIDPSERGAHTAASWQAKSEGW